jgi:hypothetical protein
VWLTPFGPVWWGISWLPFIFVGIVIALLLTAIMRPDRVRPREGGGVDIEVRANNQTLAALDVFMWILICGLFLAIIIGYLK